MSPYFTSKEVTTNLIKKFRKLIISRMDGGRLSKIIEPILIDF